MAFFRTDFSFSSFLRVVIFENCSITSLGVHICYFFIGNAQEVKGQSKPLLPGSPATFCIKGKTTSMCYLILCLLSGKSYTNKTVLGNILKALFPFTASSWLSETFVQDRSIQHELLSQGQGNSITTWWPSDLKKTNYKLGDNSTYLYFKWTGTSTYFIGMPPDCKLFR